METYSEYLAGLAMWPSSERHYCAHCHCVEEEHWLFIHEPTSDKLCQGCLTSYIASDIEVDGTGSFEGFEFRSIGPNYQVSNDDWYYVGALKDCIEAALMKMQLI